MLVIAIKITPGQTNLYVRYKSETESWAMVLYIACTHRRGQQHSKWVGQGVHEWTSNSKEVLEITAISEYKFGIILEDFPSFEKVDVSKCV